MFDLKKHTGEDRGYKLVIQYLKETNQISLNGYILMKDGRVSKDGQELFFSDLEKVLEHIYIQDL